MKTMGRRGEERRGREGRISQRRASAREAVRQSEVIKKNKYMSVQELRSTSMLSGTFY